MKIITLHDGHQTFVDDDIFEKYGKYRWYYSEQGYAIFGEKRDGIKAYCKLHRLILDAPAGLLVDHEDRDRLNNIRKNLRLVNMQGNVHNQKKRWGTINNYKGTQYVKNVRSWQARCRMNGNDFFLGYYGSEIAAAYAYNKKATELSEFILLNELPYTIEYLENLLIRERKAIKPAKNRSKYRFIYCKEKRGTMKCDKWFITNRPYKIVKGYFFTEDEAVNYYIENYNGICPTSIKKAA